MQRHRSLCASLLGLWLAAAAGPIVCADVPAEGPGWPDTFTARLEALALLETLNGDLLSHDSATETLQHWCESHRLAPDPRIQVILIAFSFGADGAQSNVERASSTVCVSKSTT